MKQASGGLKIAEVHNMDKAMIQFICDCTLLTREELAGELGIKRVGLQWIIKEGRIKQTHLERIQELAGLRVLSEQSNPNQFRIYLDKAHYIKWKNGEAIPTQLIQFLDLKKRESNQRGRFDNFTTEELIEEIQNRGWIIKVVKEGKRANG